MSINVKRKYMQGKVNQSELDPIRKGYIQRYVLYFHPDVKDPKFYQNIVVVKINL
jgi:hypothetical protein